MGRLACLACICRSIFSRDCTVQYLTEECDREEVTSPFQTVTYKIRGFDQTISLFFSAKINAMVLYIHLQIPITIMKPHEKAEVPTGVIVGSAIAGILLLLALVAILWKVRNVSYLKIQGS